VTCSAATTRRRASGRSQPSRSTTAFVALRKRALALQHRDRVHGGSHSDTRCEADASSASIIVGVWVVLFGQHGPAEASATLIPFKAVHRIVVGSRTDRSLTPRRQVEVGCVFVWTVGAAQSTISSSYATSGPGWVSPSSSSVVGRWAKIPVRCGRRPPKNRRSTGR
jgi:hypothetical protein